MIIITIILNVLGIICIITSLIVIRKTINQEEFIYDEIKSKYEDIKDYYKSINNIIDSFSYLVQESINKIENYNIQNLRKDKISDFKIYSYPKKEILKREQYTENNKDTFEKIVELKNKGMTSKDIVKN